MNEAARKRLRDHRMRLVVRAWEYRQRNHAHGIWFRLRRALAGAAEVFVVNDADVQRLVDAGHSPLPLGDTIEPRKTIVIAPREEVVGLASACSIPIGLNAAFLEATNVALVPFEARDRAAIRQAPEVAAM